MIAVDTSILVGLLRSEPDCLPMLDTLMTEEVALASTTLVEAHAWCARHVRGGRSLWLETVFRQPNVVVSPLTVEMAEIAGRALREIGRGTRHPAKLNFGDALVYGHAKALGLPLLFKGDDFNHTDLAPDPRSLTPS